MWKLYENFHIFYFQKGIFSVEIIRGNKVPYFRGDYSFLNLAKLVKEHESAETIQGSKLFAEIR